MCQFHRIMKSVTICKALKHFTFFLFFFFFWTVFMSLTNCLFEWAMTCTFLFVLLFATLQPWEIVSTFRKEEKPRGGMVIRQILVENHYFALSGNGGLCFYYLTISYHRVDAIITCVDMILYLFNTYLASQQIHLSFLCFSIFLNELMHI